MSKYDETRFHFQALVLDDEIHTEKSQSINPRKIMTEFPKQSKKKKKNEHVFEINWYDDSICFNGFFGRISIEILNYTTVFGVFQKLRRYWKLNVWGRSNAPN